MPDSLVLTKLLVTSGAGIILLLGTAHGLLTFRGTRLHPHDPDLTDRMQRITPRLTRQTTMWKAWVGFNGSHSLGAVFFGLLNILLAWDGHFTGPLWFLNLLTLSAYLVLASKYWFTFPFRGILLSLLLFSVAALIYYQA